MYSDDPPPYSSIYEQPHIITDGSTELRDEPPAFPDETLNPTARQFTELRDEPPASTVQTLDPVDRQLESAQESHGSDRNGSDRIALDSLYEPSQSTHDFPRFINDSPETASDWPQLTDGPSIYRIGSSNLQRPLVNIAYVRAHLGLLDAFKKLRVVIEHNEGLRFPPLTANLTQSQRWCWFVHLAVDRFHKWADIMHNADSLHIWDIDFVPPLDVLMVWHAYMLNPIWYAEDCERVPTMRKFQVLGDKFLPTMGLGDIFQRKPWPRLASFWLARMHTPFDPIAAAATTTHCSIECSTCLASIEVAYLTTTGTGYAQHSFSEPCPTCNHTITKESLGLNKFVKDIIAGLGVASAEIPTPVVYLAYVFTHTSNTPANTSSGTLHTQVNSSDTSGAAKSKMNLLRSAIFRRQGANTNDDWRRAIQQRLGHSIQNVARICIGLKAEAMPRLNRTLSAYTDGRPFSVDLVGAVIRQGSFIDKMYEFGWTDPTFFQDEDETIVLEHVIARYHAFLDLISTSGTLLYVPTLDIDLVWHTHQLMAKQYSTDCRSYVGRYIDHDDKIEENYLNESLEATGRAWEVGTSSSPMA
ncbi:hypothetical protein WOLCODRAFT_75486 [Wolfiporia cocos MD-104 SS10]|uniref:Uncharacterized protein n=1 Tax=Wolfiporia cocos (strain MD-104) TaxID=742152 RepID=A0A2H3K3V0_WOLCO|nr:hypothetical protein WOLCODRAFT_75486 [Wolfiporia cocos MD-104 SS10]